jgi:hypothetical protein
MAPNNTAAQAAHEATSGREAPPAEVNDLLDRLERCLEAGEPGIALDLLARSDQSSPWLKNAAGVCQLRLGNAARAVEAFRGLTLAPGGLIVRKDVPVVFRANYAAALLAADNLDGFLGVLVELEREDHPAVQRLRSDYQRWRNGMTLTERLRWLVSGVPPRPLRPGSPAGALR